MSAKSEDHIKQSALREEYISRINQVIDYIDHHLDQELNLETLARVANFSPYHFHRIFAAMMEETLNHFIQRLRVEKAASLLINNPRTSITEVAFDCGFSGPATFARAFKERYGLSASEYRIRKPFEESKNGKTESKNHQSLSKEGKDINVSFSYLNGNPLKMIWRIVMKGKQEFQVKGEVEVKMMDPMVVAYVRHVGPYKGDEQLFAGLFQKLMTWAGPRDLLNFPETQALCVYHDNPEITEEEKLRTSVCISIPKDTEVDGEIGKMTLPGGKYAVAHFEINGDQYQEAWNMVFGGWLPESGYQPDDRPCFEICHNNPKEHPENKHVVDICVPVKPL